MRDALGDVQSVLLLGGTSDIGLAICRELTDRRAARVVLAGRDQARLRDAAATLGPGRDAQLVDFDATDAASRRAALAQAFDGGDVDLAVVAWGVLGDQPALLGDGDAAAALIEVNTGSAAAVLLDLAARMRAQGHGTIVVLSSVAGERARRSNFVYGASKAGLDAFAQGLGDELAGDGIRVLVVRPGFVRSKMTTGLDPAPLATTPDAVARAVRRALGRGGVETVWVPGALRWVMLVLRHLPRAVFRRLDI